MSFVKPVALFKLGLLCATSVCLPSGDLHIMDTMQTPTGSSGSSVANGLASLQQPGNLTAAALPPQNVDNVIDVVVKDKQGNYIDDLTAADFSIHIDGKQQAIGGFYPPDTAVAAADIRKDNVLVVLLDVLDTKEKSPSYFSQQLLRAFPAISDDGSFAVFVLDANGLHVVVDFGSTKQELRNAINHGRLIVAPSSIVSPRNRDNLLPHNRDNCDSLRDRYTNVSRALGFLEGALAKSSGHKSVIWLTQEAPIINSSGAYDVLRLVNTADRKVASSPPEKVAFYPVLTDGLGSNWTHLLAAKGGCANLAGGFDESDAFERSVGTISSGPSPLPNSVENLEENSLYKLAEATGGFFFSTPRDLGKAISLATEDRKHLYKLAIPSAPPQKKNSYHTIGVMTQQQGLLLQYQKGYFAK